jgi:hypothetical protein
MRSGRRRARAFQAALPRPVVHYPHNPAAYRAAACASRAFRVSFFRCFLYSAMDLNFFLRFGLHRRDANKQGDNQAGDANDVMRHGRTLVEQTARSQDSFTLTRDC